MLVYASNLFVPILEIDAAQYAEMSREMLQTSNWLHVYDGGADYLDKPPFLFWVSALSMKLFGVSTWAYKLPSILFAIWAIYALYRFTKLFYNQETAHTAAIIFASCQAMFLVTNDIKTDTILLSFTITAFWQISNWLYQAKRFGWIWGALCIGGGMLTKGPIALLIIGFGFLPHFIIKKQWSNILRWQYIPMLIIIGVVLLPMSIGLYEQFDLHPEKTVNGENGVSGLRFFYWTQSFGRITGESVWNNNAGFTFLYENLLWGLIPFTLFFLMGTIRGFLKLWHRVIQTEWISTSAVLLGYISLGMSHFQLPHYIYVILPFICLLIARYFTSTKNFFPHKFRMLRVLHNGILYIAFLSFPILLYLIFPDMNHWQITLLFLSSLVIIALIISEHKKQITLLAVSVSLAIIFNILLNFVFYSNLFPYQKEYTVAKKVKELKLDPKKLSSYDSQVLRSLDFLLQENIFPVWNMKAARAFDYIVTSDKGLKTIQEAFTNSKVLYSGERYHIAKIQIGFLNPTTRSKHTEQYHIVKIR